MIKILDLALRDAVQDAHGTVGEVVGFGRDCVRISWSDREPVGYTDADLSAQCITRWSPIRKVSR